MKPPASKPEREHRGLLWVNDRFVDPDEARVSPLEHGFLYGDGAFETLRTYDGRPFRLRAHLDRLEAALARLSIAGAPPSARLGEIVEETLRQASLAEAYCRITVARGRGDRGLDPAGCTTPTVVVAVLPLRTYPESHYTNGVAAAFLWRRASGDQPPPSVKSTSYQRTVLARIELARVGADEGFYLDEDGHVAEGTVSNVFVVHGNALSTPPREVCLAGVTRAEVITLARSMQLRVDEEPIAQQRLLEADEVFVTSSLAEVLPVVRVGDVAIGRGAPGSLTAELHARYRERTRAGEAAART